MDQQKLKDANETLDQKKPRGVKFILKIILIIILSVVVLFISLVGLYLLAGIIYNTYFYPYIAPPRNTVNSRSIPELVCNLITDTNDTATFYSVYKQRHRSWA